MEGVSRKCWASLSRLKGSASFSRRSRLSQAKRSVWDRGIWISMKRSCISKRAFS